MKPLSLSTLNSKGIFFGLGWGDLVGVFLLWGLGSFWIGGWSLFTFFLFLPLSVIRLHCRPRIFHTWAWFVGNRLFQPPLWIPQRKRR